MREPDQPYRPSPAESSGPDHGGQAHSETWYIPTERLVTVGELWDLSFRLMFACMVPLAIIVLLIQLPINLLSTYADLYVATDDGALLSDSYLFRLISWMIGIATSLAILFVGRDVLIDGSPGGFEIISSRIAQRFLAALTTDLLMILLVAALFLLLIIPGVIGAVYMSLALPIVALRGRKNTEALRYSKRLVTDHWGDVFTRIIVLAMPVILVIGLIVGFEVANESGQLPEFLHADRSAVLAREILTLTAIDITLAFQTLAGLILFLNLDALKREPETGETSSRSDAKPSIR